MSEIRKPDVDKIINVLKTAKNQVLNINGTWGSGKTYVANMAFEQLKDNENEPVIYINLSDYEYVNDPLVPFLINILDYVNLQQDDSILDNPNFLKPVSGIISILSLGSLFVDSSGTTASALNSLKSIIENVKECKDTKDSIEPEQREQLKAVRSYTKALKEMDELINVLCTLIKKDRLIIFIDDFDRTNPKFSFRVLNIIHQLKGFDKLAICTIMNRVQFEKQLVHIYGDLPGSDEHYLTKFIDLEYMVTNPFNLFDPNERFESNIRKFDELCLQFQIPKINLSNNIILIQARTLSMRELKIFSLNLNKLQAFPNKTNQQIEHLFLFVYSKFEFELKSVWYDLLNAEQVDKLNEAYASYMDKLLSNLNKSLHTYFDPITTMFKDKILTKQKVYEKYNDGDSKGVFFNDSNLALRDLISILRIYEYLITT